MDTERIDVQIRRALAVGPVPWSEIVAHVGDSIDEAHNRLRQLEEQGLIEVDWRRRIVRASMKAPEVNL